MSACWSEGELRAHLDGELQPSEMVQVAAHLQECADCEAQSQQLAARAAMVATLMSALPVAARPARSHWWPAAAALALAAAIVMVFVLMPKRGEEHKVTAVVVKTEIPAAVEAHNIARTPAQAKGMRHHARPAAHVDYYLALDNEPIETGVVMRVAMGNGDFQADVIVDSDGRARAVRAVN